MKKLVRLLVYKLARVSGIESHIRLKQRLEIAGQLEECAKYFRDSLWKSPRAANAMFHFSYQLRDGLETPNREALIRDVTLAANEFLFVEKPVEPVTTTAKPLQNG